MKSIALVTAELARHDAVGNYVCAVARELSKDYGVSIFTFASSQDIVHDTQSIELVYYTDHHRHDFYGEMKALLSFPSIGRALAKHDLILIMTERPMIPPVLLARIVSKKVKLIWDFHGITPPRDYSSIRRHLIELVRLAACRYLMKFCDCCVVHSRFMMSEVRNYFGGPVFIVPLGVDLRRFRPDVDNEIVRAKYGLQNRFTLLYVGRLSHYKRVWFMIRALAALKDPSVRLVIAGEGEERGRLENYAKALEVEDQTIFLGDVSDEELPQIYAACDVFITASLHEGVCVPILEAFAAAKPALVPDLTAMPETTDGGGLVYQWDSIADLVQKVRILRADKTLRLRLGRIGLEKVARQDTARVCREYRLSLDQIVRNLSH